MSIDRHNLYIALEKNGHFNFVNILKLIKSNNIFYWLFRPTHL